MNFEIIFYETEDGKSPAKEFLDSQNSKMRKKIDRNLKMLKELGTRSRMPLSEHLKDGIFQLRSQIGNDISRVLYFFYVGQDIVITNGFTKKTQTTPPDEIEKAKKYRDDYFERMGKNDNV